MSFTKPITRREKFSHYNINVTNKITSKTTTLLAFHYEQAENLWKMFNDSEHVAEVVLMIDKKVGFTLIRQPA